MEFSLEEIDKVACEIVEQYSHFRIFTINGEMGAGKTTFSKAFCKCLKVDEEVNSPTFAIANVYNSEAFGEVFHFDFYRLKDAQEAVEIGLSDYLYAGKYCLMEWSDIIIDYIPKPYVEVNITLGEDMNTRRIKTKLID